MVTDVNNLVVDGGYMSVVSSKFDALLSQENVTVLGIESSCDETAIAIVRNGKTILSSVIASQISIHTKFGGVVPEVASRNHLLAIEKVLTEALSEAHMTLLDIDAIAVTYGAGLIGALLVGVSYAKGLSYATQIPLIKVNHIEAHICSNFVEYDIAPPLMAVVASGGHTSVVEVKDYNDYVAVGSTRDDAIGEAFDKVARLLGLPYPGGPNVDRLAKLGQANIDFFKTAKKVNADYSLSYSGLKTAVVNYIHNAKQKSLEINQEDICASFTKSACDILIDTAIKATIDKGYRLIALAGGVASNSYLRENLKEKALTHGIEFVCPSPILCTDNAVMIASRGYYSIRKGQNLADLTLNATSSLELNS